MRTSDLTGRVMHNGHSEELHNLSNRKLWMLFKEVEHVVANNEELYQAISQELLKRNQFKPDCRWSFPH